MTTIKGLIAAVSAAVAMGAMVPAFASSNASGIVGEGFPSMRSGYDSPRAAVTTPTAQSQSLQAGGNNSGHARVGVGEGFPAVGVTGQRANGPDALIADRGLESNPGPTSAARQEGFAGFGEGFAPRRG